jgi:hypothetical protein
VELGGRRRIIAVGISGRQNQGPSIEETSDECQWEGDILGNALAVIETHMAVTANKTR